MDWRVTLTCITSIVIHFVDIVSLRNYANWYAKKIRYINKNTSCYVQESWTATQTETTWMGVSSCLFFSSVHWTFLAEGTRAWCRDYDHIHMCLWYSGCCSVVLKCSVSVKLHLLYVASCACIHAWGLLNRLVNLTNLSERVTVHVEKKLTE